jgi:hypothetical protein
MRTPKAPPRPPLGRARFRKYAKPVPVKVGRIDAGQAKPKESANTGSLGWGLSRKLYLSVGGETVYCQMNVSITIIGSKNSQEGQEGTPPPDNLTEIQGDL